MSKKVNLLNNEGDILYPQTQAELVIGGLSYEDLNEEIEINPTDLIQEWQAYQERVNAIVEAYQQQVISLREELNEVKVRYVVETYKNGTDWYVIYNDKWCEQGGFINVANGKTQYIDLLKPFVDINYSLVDSQGSIGNASGHSSYTNSLSAYSNSQIYFAAYDTNAVRSLHWEAKGYIL